MSNYDLKDDMYQAICSMMDLQEKLNKAYTKFSILVSSEHGEQAQQVADIILGAERELRTSKAYLAIVLAYPRAGRTT